MSSKKVKDQQYYDSKNRAAWNAVTANHRDGEEAAAASYSIYLYIKKRKKII